MQWVSANLVVAFGHIVKCRRFQRSTPMKVSYERVRLAPNGQLAQQLVESTLEVAMIEEECDENDRRSVRDGETASEIMRDIFGDEADVGYESSRQGVLEPNIISSNAVGRPGRGFKGRVPSIPDLGCLEHVYLKRTEYRKLKDLHKNISTNQVVRYGRITHSLPHLAKKAVRDEMEATWDGADEQVNKV